MSLTKTRPAIRSSVNAYLIAYRIQLNQWKKSEPPGSVFCFPNALDDYDRVLKLAETASAQLPNEPVCCEVLAAVLLRRGRFDEASQKILSISEDRSDPLKWWQYRSFLLAIIEFHRGKISEAEYWFSHGLEQDKKELELRGNLHSWTERLNITALRNEAALLLGHNVEDAK